ncbi:MAG: hypothetical protein ABS52_11190 [Gemmatimonadetes bacterium SCN 70-22]|nr:MAG: hypothetical protein ABS52_11190 [Gemmatimonadetes bacterium SCN 70-22]
MTAAALTPSPSSTPLWTTLADELDVAPSLYERATDRHTSLGEWLCRPESSLARYEPSVRPQGSFRFGTVIKPLVEGATYDLDQVVTLRRLGTQDLSQFELKRRLGVELAAYARAHGMQALDEKHRCWRLKYRDEVAFHLDSLPSVPAAEAAVLQLRRLGVDERWALRAVAITDDRHPQYNVVGAEWLTSNPSGFARWFEARAALGRAGATGRSAQASVEEVPPYEWRTPLQRAVQILKRHRDVMFQNAPSLAPISMIITNLAAQAYEGEQDLGQALAGIVERMGQYVRASVPRVPNPTHPAEDYADKWRLQPALEDNFWRWVEQVRTDVRYFSQQALSPDLVQRRFAIRLSEDQQRRLTNRAASAAAAPAIVAAAAPARIDGAPRPWQSTPRDRSTY